MAKQFTVKQLKHMTITNTKKSKTCRCCKALKREGDNYKCVFGNKIKKVIGYKGMVVIRPDPSPMLCQKPTSTHLHQRIKKLL